jgi:hypothetical protein
MYIIHTGTKKSNINYKSLKSRVNKKNAGGGGILNISNDITISALDKVMLNKP